MQQTIELFHKRRSHRNAWNRKRLGHSRRYNTSVSVKTFDLYEEMEIPGNHLQTADDARQKEDTNFWNRSAREGV